MSQLLGLPDPNSGWWEALIAALSGGAITKLLDKYFGQRQRVQDQLSTMEKSLREELQKEKTELRKEIAELRKEVDSWKEKYYLVLKENIELKTKLSHYENDFSLEEHVEEK